MSDRPLMDFSPGAGCGCKLSSVDLQDALAAMTVEVPTSADVMVGLATSDDAGVYRLDGTTALVQTLDFFTPIVDDPFVWGQIAAVNALSDVFAMGGRPITAMNIVGWPRAELDLELLAAVLDGGASILAKAGCVLVGGHSIDDPVPKYGLSVSGLVDTRSMLTNAAGRSGDALVLTKALGTGIATTAMKRGVCPPQLERSAIESMTTLNADAARLAVDCGVVCATDVTGFGLMGHLGEMLRASGVSATIDGAVLPVFEGVMDLITEGVVPGGSVRNFNAAGNVDWGVCREEVRIAACDAQTSGGLLVAVPVGELDRLLRSAAEREVPAWRIGELDDHGPVGSVRVT